MRYIDCEEEETILVAMTPQDLYINREDADTSYKLNFTHCEIHPSMVSLPRFPDRRDVSLFLYFLCAQHRRSSTLRLRHIYGGKGAPQKDDG